MKSVVLELQQEALNKSIHVSDLLRKALVVVRKLGLNEFQTWIEKELNGYEKTDSIPSYREASGKVRGWHPCRGWIPLFFEDTEFGEKLSSRRSIQSIAELEDLTKNPGKDSFLHMPFSQDVQKLLRICTGSQIEFMVLSTNEQLE